MIRDLVLVVNCSSPQGSFLETRDGPRLAPVNFLTRAWVVIFGGFVTAVFVLLFVASYGGGPAAPEELRGARGLQHS